MRSQIELALRYYGRYLIQKPSFYRPNGLPHIFVFSSRRGGSTLLSDMIYSQPGFNYIAEPYNFTYEQFNPYRRFFNNYSRGQFVTLSDDQKIVFKKYTDGLLARKYIPRSQWRFWRKDYHWVWGRYVVKDVNAKALIRWFETSYGDAIRIVYHTRHPFAAASSVLEWGWEHHYDLFLNDVEFNEKYITSKMRLLTDDISRNGSDMEEFVLDWCFENYLPLKYYKDHKWVTVSYEKIVATPLETSERLCRLLDMPNPNLMTSVIQRPSVSATRRSQKKILESGPQSRLFEWQKVVTRENLVKLAKILEAFEIDLYTIDSPYAKNEFDS